jgi:hypothetical protein
MLVSTASINSSKPLKIIFKLFITHEMPYLSKPFCEILGVLKKEVELDKRFVSIVVSGTCTLAIVVILVLEKVAVIVL